MRQCCLLEETHFTPDGPDMLRQWIRAAYGIYSFGIQVVMFFLSTMAIAMGSFVPLGWKSKMFFIPAAEVHPVSPTFTFKKHHHICVRRPLLSAEWDNPSLPLLQLTSCLMLPILSSHIFSLHFDRSSWQAYHILCLGSGVLGSCLSWVTIAALAVRSCIGFVTYSHIILEWNGASSCYFGSIIPAVCYLFF